jgi:GNAT superfamily N-acetyltransferase
MADAGIAMRLATTNDIAALRVLIERSVRGLQAGDYTPAQIEGAVGYAFGVDAQLIEDGHYFIAEIAGEAVGCGGWSDRRTLFGSDRVPHREDGPLDPAVDFAKIRAIFVDPDQARKGIGSAILLHCERAAMVAGFSRFEMGSTLTGVPLYSLKGYKEAGLIEVPLPNGESLPIVRMTKTL